MNDIYDIKNILNISPFFKETVYLIILFLIILVFIYLFKKFKKKYINIIETKENLIKNNLNLKNLYLKKLKNLNINDLNYFLKISYIVREFLEKTWTIDKSTKKTCYEIKKNTEIEYLYDLINDCDKFNFSKTQSTTKDKEDILNRAIKIILTLNI